MQGFYALRWQILTRDNFTCQYCGQKAPNCLLEVDHKIPVSEGGKDEPDNLVAACYACNRGKAGLNEMLNRQRKPKLYQADGLIQEYKPLLSDKICEVLMAAPKGLSVQDVSRALTYSNLDALRVTFSKLRKRGRIKSLQRGLWVIT